MVLTQHVGNKSFTPTVFSFHTTMVLTQRNGFAYIAFYNTFPYHYGSHATPEIDVVSGRSVTFPYHYGSHATWDVIAFVEGAEPFPYHYGSHATHGITCNEFCRLRFHTTMVLTQREDNL